MSFEECNKIKRLMSNYDKSWFVAGGWAIDLYLGKETRNHQDIEIAILRQDQCHLKHYLKDWTFNKVANGQLYTWENEYLTLPIHELHALNNNSGERLEILLNETANEYWIFRRHKNIVYPLNSVWGITKTGIPYLNPEIVLLYKAKNTREKDHKDFMNVINLLNDEKKKWLSDALELHVPGHQWLHCLI